MNNALGVNIPLSTFGGMSTELAPSDLPEGGSPDNSDVAYLPGTVQTRPGLSRVYANPPTSAAIVYSESFTRKDGTVFNVLMDANGVIWAENFTVVPGSFVQVGSVPAGSFCKSVAANGRLFMTFNDGLRGTDLPRSYDGINFNRVSQGGPCGNPTFSETIAPSVALGNGASTATPSITSIVSSDLQDYITTYYAGPNIGWVEVQKVIYSTLTITLSSVTGIVVGGTISWTGNTAVNLTNAVVSAIIGSTVKINYNSQFAISGTGGTLTVAAPNLSRYQNVVTAYTSAAHNMQQGDMFTLSGVSTTSLGTITAAVRISNVITITTSTPNGVRVGSIVVIAGVTDTTFNGTWTVTGVLDQSNFQVDSSNLADSSSSGGTVSGQWNNTQRFVISTPTSTSLTYLDQGPDASTTSAGTITPVGQVAGGIRDAVCFFITNYGYLTGPSVPVQVSTSGGKKLVINALPLGPSNVVARGVAFTGINGANYFYIPVPARSNGNVISTSTVVNDNTSTSAIFDFGDATLLSASAIDIDGNNLFNLKILGNCSGVFPYADRLMWWGDENKAINFQNMGFEGGIDANGNPFGWTVSGTGLSVTPIADFGDGIKFAAGSTAIVYQSAFLDYFGDQILQPSTQYTFKCWAKQSGTSALVVAELYDTNTNTVLTNTILQIPRTGFVSGKFSAQTPAVIPTTLVLRVRVTNNSTSIVTLDEMSCIFSAKPYNDTTFSVSYINNPESVDDVTGILGATVDPTPIMDAGRLRDNLYFVTQQAFHTTKNQSSSEPSGWDVNEIAEQCGACTMQSMISGEGWLSWGSQDGARIFDGSQPIKITQDFQSEWSEINQTALTSIWAVNDSANRRIYWGVPLGTSTLSNKVYSLDYRYAETGAAIAERGAIRVSPYNGKMLVIEMSRKFAPWNIPASGGGFLMTSQGLIPTLSDNVGRTYWLNPAQYHDDDYGVINGAAGSYYVTSPFVSQDLEQALQLGNHRHLFTFVSLFISGVGQVTITPLADDITNNWPARGPYNLILNPNRPMEIPLNVGAGKCFFRISVQPVKGSTDAFFSLSRMVVGMEPHPYSPIAGALPVASGGYGSGGYGDNSYGS